MSRPKVKRPPGWYSKAAKEQRSKARLERRRQREQEKHPHEDHLRNARRARRERTSEVLRRSVANIAAVDSTRSKPKARYGIKPKDNESAPMYAARVGALRSAVKRHQTLANWSHKNEGTPETHEHASRTRQGALSRLYMAGHISVDELYWASEIAAAAEMIQRDVDARISSYEMRVDYSGSGRDSVFEGIVRVRMQIAYGYWRERIPEPRHAVLDMLVGEPVPYSTVALRYGMGKTKARRLLIDAINLWPEADAYAEDEVDPAELAAAQAGLMGG